MILINTTAAHHLVSIRNHIQPMPSLTQVWLSRNSGACCRSLRRLYQCFPAAEEAGVYDSVLFICYILEYYHILSQYGICRNMMKHDQTCMSAGYFLTHPRFSTDPPSAAPACLLVAGPGVSSRQPGSARACYHFVFEVSQRFN